MRVGGFSARSIFPAKNKGNAMFATFIAICLLGPTPAPGFHYDWANSRMVLQVETGGSHAVAGFGETFNLRSVRGLFVNDSGNEVPLTGTATAGHSETGEAVWKVSLTGTLVQSAELIGFSADLPPIYHVMTLHLEVAQDRVGLFGERDDAATAWGRLTGWNLQWPVAPQEGDDLVVGADVWRVPCE
jgi:hypothetical protein